MVVFGLSLGMKMPIYTLIVQNAVERRVLGAAKAATQFFRQIGGTFGTAICTSIMLSRFSSYFDANVPAAIASAVRADPGRPPVLEAMLTNVKESLVYAIQGSFLFGAVLVALACGVNFFLQELPLRKSFAEEPAAPALADRR